MDELLELELDELFELLFDERRVGWSGVRPTARAARFMPFSHPFKALCTALSPRGLPRLLLLDELLLLLLDELELRFEDELDDEFEDEFEDELEDEFDDELELPLELLFELLLPALILSGFTLCSTSCAMSAKPLADGRPCACAPVLPTRPAMAVTITPSCCFMENLFRCQVADVRPVP